MKKNKQGIIDFYENKTILVTGTTGFVGKVILEKLLFILKNIKIIVIIRAKVNIIINLIYRKGLM